MNYDTKETLRGGVERALERNRDIELIVPRLKRIWPSASNRRELLEQVEAFAAENLWSVIVRDFRFRVRLSKVRT
jgi:hypothetical protein